MWRGLERAFWWLVAYERPRGRGDYAALVAFVGLALLGAVVVTWPWLIELLWRGLATGWALLQGGGRALVERLRSATLPGG